MRREGRIWMTRIDFAPLLMGVDTLEVALETLQRHGAGGRVSNRLRTSMISMFALVVEHFGKALGRRLRRRFGTP